MGTREAWVATEALREKFGTGFVSSSTEKLGSAQFYLHCLPAFVFAFLHCALTLIHQRAAEVHGRVTWAGLALQRPIT